jgi:hypothetical protein
VWFIVLQDDVEVHTKAKAYDLSPTPNPSICPTLRNGVPYNQNAVRPPTSKLPISN